MVSKKGQYSLQKEVVIESSYRMRNIVKPKTSSKILISDTFIH